MSDNIKVNSSDWKGLSNEDQEKITNLLKVTGLMKSGSNITPDETIKTAAMDLDTTSVAAAWPWCTIACNVGEAAAVAACATFSGPAAAVCVAAAHAAGQVCRDNC